MSSKERDRAWWAGQVQFKPVYGRAYELTSQYVEMRDGVRLAVDVYLPADRQEGERLPAILNQTRYYRRTRYRFPFSQVRRWLDPFEKLVRDFLSNGYAMVMMDVRGTGASFGTRSMEWSPDEVRDGAEVVEWIIAQSWSNGSVGATGVSYAGTSAEMLLTNCHPAVKAAQIQFALFDAYADISHPGGVRQDGFLRTWSDFNDALDADELAALARKKISLLASIAVLGVQPVDNDPKRELLQEAIADHATNYNVYHAVQSIEYRDDRSETGVSFEAFSPHSFMPQLRESRTAIYNWSSYYDGAYTLAAIKRFLNIDVPGKRLILGPWDHGATQAPDPHITGKKIAFDYTGEMLRYFDAYLKEVENGLLDEPPVHYYTMGEEVWKAAKSWPPPGFEPKPFFLAKGGRLLVGAPPTETGCDRYQVDYTATSGQSSRWVALVNVARATIGYPDRKEQDEKLLVYQTDPLADAVEVTGHPVVALHLRADAEDLQLFVYLEDVTPQGDVHYVTEGLFRAIHRRISAEEPPVKLPPGIPYHTYRRADALPLEPGKAAVLAFDLLPVSYLFGKGHAIRLAIAGADKDNFQLLPPEPPAIEMLRGPEHPSHILLPVG